MRKSTDDRNRLRHQLLNTHRIVHVSVLQGETHEDWYPLNGKQGDGVEGMINLVLTYTVSML